MFEIKLLARSSSSNPFSCSKSLKDKLQFKNKLQKPLNCELLPPSHKYCHPFYFGMSHNFCHLWKVKPHFKQISIFTLAYYSKLQHKIYLKYTPKVMIMGSFGKWSFQICNDYVPLKCWNPKVRQYLWDGGSSIYKYTILKVS